MGKPLYKKIALDIFKKIKYSYPNLNMEIIENHPHLELLMDIPEQENMKFQISVNLQNNDELHLNVGKLWMCWFPCSEQNNQDDFIDVIKGLIDGDYRIMETIKGSKVVKAILQKPSNENWISKSSGMFTFKLPSFSKKEYRIIQNKLNV